MAAKQSLVGIEINARRKQVEVKTRQKGSGRHNLFASLNSGYESMTQVEELVTSELVLPEDEEEEAPAKKPVAKKPAAKKKA